MVSWVLDLRRRTMLEDFDLVYCLCALGLLLGNARQAPSFKIPTTERVILLLAVRKKMVCVLRICDDSHFCVRCEEEETSVLCTARPASFVKHASYLNARAKACVHPCLLRGTLSAVVRR